LQAFVKSLKAPGLARARHPDVFGYITLQGAAPKGQKLWNFEAANATKQEVDGALDPLDPVDLATVEESDEVTHENIDRYIVNRNPCFQGEYTFLVPDAVRRTANQLVHWQHCLDMVVEQERKSLARYEVVMIARPDVSYNVDRSRGIDLQEVANGRVYTNKDWIFLMPRKVAGLLLSPTRARPLRCNRGEPCCGELDRSEKIWEYLMGVKVDSRASCNCGPSFWETGPLRINQDHMFTNIVRPKLLG